MIKEPDILCIGAVLWDIIGRATPQMRVGSDVPGKISRIPGGVALNIAMAIQAYGLKPALMSVVGRDDEGEDLMRACARMEIIVDHIYRSDDLPTDRYMAIEGANGLIAAVADAHSLEAAGDKILRPLKGGALDGWSGIIALDGNLTHDLLGGIAHEPAFARADLRIAPASPGKAERLKPFLTHSNATLYVNLEEAGLLMHCAFEASAQAASAMRAQGLKRVLVTDGANAASVATADEIFSEIPPKVTVSRFTGAGDTFMAAHIAAEVKGSTGRASLIEALDATAVYISGETY
ncbi:MAG: PfkB family carbohydrate kinase [Litoreibacter sp.]